MKKTTKYYGLVNRKRVIATLEAKALITGFSLDTTGQNTTGLYQEKRRKR